MIAEEFLQFMRGDTDVIAALETVRRVCPARSFIAAGFVRNRVWDSLYPKGGVFPAGDVDVVYFDRCNPVRERDDAFEQALIDAMPGQQWQVRNQAYMHDYGGHAPFQNLEHGLTHWPETATAVGVRLTDAGELEVLAPFGLSDLLEHVLRITPVMRAHDPAVFERRLQAKGWKVRWPNLKIIGG